MRRVSKSRICFNMNPPIVDSCFDTTFSFLSFSLLLRRPVELQNKKKFEFKVDTSAQGRFVLLCVKLELFNSSEWKVRVFPKNSHNSPSSLASSRVAVTQRKRACAAQHQAAHSERKIFQHRWKSSMQRGKRRKINENFSLVRSAVGCVSTRLRVWVKMNFPTWKTFSSLGAFLATFSHFFHARRHDYSGICARSVPVRTRKKNWVLSEAKKRKWNDNRRTKSKRRPKQSEIGWSVE